MEKKELLYSTEQFEKIAEEGGCLLYGAGRVTRAVVKYAAQKGYKFEGILVSDMQGNPDTVLGISVQEIRKRKEKYEDRCLIVSSMENLHKELEEEVSGYHFRKKYFVTNVLFKEMLYEIGDYEIEQLYEFRKVEDLISAQKQSLLRLVPRPCMEYMILNILDHCNLKCKGCDHFACIADPYFVPYETIHRDLDRLSKLFQGDNIQQIGVMGGEPLLHPELLHILEDVRRCFPHTIIRLTTNGLLLLKMDQKFWDTCRKNDVTIVNTKYPINLDFEKMEVKAKQEGVKFQFFEGTEGRQVRRSFKKIINLKGNGNTVENFADCPIANHTNFLMEGKLYGCPFSCQSYRIFNGKFQQNLRITEKDFLDIYKVQDMQEVFDFAARPKYYCRYCSGRSSLFDWTRSKGEMCEWVE